MMMMGYHHPSRLTMLDHEWDSRRSDHLPVVASPDVSSECDLNDRFG
jgi:hypothetical protein